MRKSDLKSGYLVQLRNGNIYKIARVGSHSAKILVSHYDWMYLDSNYTDELKFKKAEFMPYFDFDLDIVRVYGLVQGTNNYSQALAISTDSRHVLWEGEKEMTVEEIEEKLGCKIKIVGGKKTC